MASSGTVVPISGDRLSGFVLPIEAVEGDLSFRATQAWTWTVDDTTRLLLRGDVEIFVSGTTFRANEAAVWLNRIPSADGLINQVALYFDEANAPTQRAGLAPRGRDLLVTSSARGEVRLRAPFTEESRPAVTGILTRGERRLSDHLRRLLVQPPPLSPILNIDRPSAAPPPQIPVPGASPELRPDQLPTSMRLPSETGLNLFNPRGLVAFSGGLVTIEERSDTIVLERGVVIDSLDEEASEGPRRLTLTAQRAVVFLRPGTVEAVRTGRRQVQTDRVLGIYLEGDVVASDGQYTVRSGRIYYDVPGNRALLADAVLRTYVRGTGLPVVVRAGEMRQLSRDQWTSQRAVVSTSEFFTPHLGIGARDVTITRTPGAPSADGASPAEVVTAGARDVTLRASGVPFFYWPSATVDNGDIPLRSAGAGYSDDRGAAIETSWDFLALAGAQPNPNLEADLIVNAYSKRGPALGTRLKYDYLGNGNLELFGLHDDGTDKTSAGEDVDPSTKWRGLALAEHRAAFADYWTLDVQASWISDRTFVSSWREDDFATRREYETSAYLLRQQDNHGGSILAKYDLNNFISNEWLLGSRGYSVERMPEATYRRIGDDLFQTITWTQEWRASRMRLLATKGTPRELGIPAAAFGVGPNDDIRDSFSTRGVSSSAIGRLDTRHELSIPFAFANLKIAPFVSGQAISYMESDFEQYNSDAEDFRWLGAGGVRASTQFQYVNNSVESRFFDLHRVRHIIEPGLVAWYGYSNVPDGAYPVYDEDAESIGGATAYDMNIRNTFQTQRGGPGRWRSVDFLTVDLGGVLNSGDANRESPTPQFNRRRPELSRFGDHLYGNGIWQLTDTLALTGAGIWDLEDDDLARGSTGVELQHSPDFTTFVEYRTIEAEDSELIEIGWDYRLSRKYRVICAPQIDLREGGFRAATFSIIRTFPDFFAVVSLGYDDIKEETTFSATLTPVSY